MVMATESAFQADKDLLNPAEADVIHTLVASLLVAKESEDAAVVEAATTALAKGTEAFAAMRMNRGIQQALAGKNIESI
jgi:molecular chaperone HscA